MQFNKLPISTVIALALSTTQVFAAPPSASSAPKAATESQTDTISYAVGASVGRNFKKENVEINSKEFIAGFKDAIGGEKLKISEEEFKSVLTNFQRDMRNKMVANQREEGVKNKKLEEEFLAKNSKNEGVVSLPSGLQYKIIKAGNGPKVQDSDIAEVNYRGTLLDGTQFDATLPGKSANLKIGQVIAGWKEGIKLMPTGSKWQFFIPAKLAYGEKGVGSDIGPNEMLIFDIELVSIKK